MVLNRKAHFDPICIVGTMLVLAVGGLMIYLGMSGKTIPMSIIGVFAALVLVSHVLHIFHHGFTPISGIIGIASIVVAILLIRFTIGNADGFGTFYLENMLYIAGGLMFLDFIKIFVP